MNSPRTQRRGLGRGLGSLIPTTAPVSAGAPEVDRDADPDRAATAVDTGPDLAPVEGATFAELPVGAIRPNSVQPRQVFDEEAMAELVDSIREVAQRAVTGVGA